MTADPKKFPKTRKVEIPRIKIRGHVYRIVRLHRDAMPPGRDGDTDAPSVKDKEIRIHDDLEKVEELDTYIHEFLHVAFPDLREEVVVESATSIAKALWRLGYRRVK